MTAALQPDGGVGLPAVAGLIRFERLEFGKMTTDPDGPIVAGAEHQRLGRSRGFSERLAESCEPSMVGAIGNASDRRPEAARHGTVLRPVMVDGTVVPVFCRERLRPEGGEDASGRRYTVARYLSTSLSVPTPLAFFEAMESLPLRGIGRAELPDLLPIDAVVRQGSELRPADVAFVRQAVAYVMSGVPIVIAGGLPEHTFFELAAAVWLAVPPSLRVLFSAGWGVGASLSGALTMVCSDSIADNAAVFRVGAGRWEPPRTLILKGEESPDDVRPFDEQRLVAGRMYEWFAWRPDGAAPSTLVPSTEALLLLRELPRWQYEALPDMRDRAVVRAFRQPGLSAWDEHHVRQLSAWIRGSNAPMTVSSAFSYAASRRRALLIAVEGVQGAASRPRSEEFLWSALGSEHGAELEGYLRDVSAPGAARARLIALLALGADAAATLEALVHAVAVNEAEDLSVSVSSALVAAWERATLGLRETEMHCRLLSGGSLPSFYVQWVRQHAVMLLFAIATWRVPPWESGLEGIERTADNAAIATLRFYVQGGRPRPVDLDRIAALDPQHFASFARLLSADWNRPVPDLAAHRETLLRWAERCRPEPLQDAVLRFAIEGSTGSPEDVEFIASAVERAAVPPSIHVAVAALMLREWSAMSQRIAVNRAAWADITRLWPPMARTVLLEEQVPVGAPADAQVVAAENELELSSDEVQTLIERWVPRFPLQQHATADVATFLWRLAARARPTLSARRRAVELITEIERGNLTPGGATDERETALAVQLLHGSALAFGADHRESLWRSAVTPWQVQFVLELFPASEVRPSVAQMEAAAHIRSWLRQHLRGRGRAAAGAVDAFRVATADFHSLDYQNHRERWAPELGQSFLWAAFSGVPVESQGNLRAALLHYGTDVASRRQLAIRYLDATPAASRQEAIHRVMRDHVVQDVLTDLPHAAMAVVFREAGEQRRNSAFARIGRVVQGAWLALTRAPRLRVDADPQSPDVRLQGSTVIISAPFFDWLRGLGATPDVVHRVLHEVRR